VKYIAQKVFILLLMGACIKPYDLKLEDADEYIVVEGLITNETGPHEVRLSHTSEQLDEGFNTIDDAKVWIVDQDDNSTEFRFTKDGTYQSPGTFSGEVGNNYQLFIELADGRVIASEPEEILPSTKITSIHHRYGQSPNAEGTENIGGLQFFIDAAPGPQSINYYRYDWLADYRIDVTDPAYYKLVADTLMIDTAQQLIYYIISDPDVLLSCYQSDTSKSLIYASTETSNVGSVLDFPVNFVSETSQRLSRRYALQVKQYSISASAYYYYKTLDEQNNYGGSLFDKQTGLITGNLSFEDESEPVIGYFEVASVDSLRKFFDHHDFDERLELPYYWYYCSEGHLENYVGPDRVAFLQDSLGREVYITYHDGYLGKTVVQVRPFCSDCSYYANTVPPDYWIP
jgi:hypothetical protein